MIMPVAFMSSFPGGLVLYWVVNNILSIAQQWVINRQVVSGDKPAAGKT
jgi:YidC/Oxa1 family membrane protein insertase